MTTPNAAAGTAAVRSPAPKPKPPERKIVPPVPVDKYAELGDSVEWYAGADISSPPMVGMITGIGIGTVDLNVFSSHLHNTSPQEGVIHMDDPRKNNAAIAEGGGWRHRPLTIATRKLLVEAGILVWDGDQKYAVNGACDVSGLRSLFEAKPEKPAS